jgi:hemerythrin
VEQKVVEHWVEWKPFYSVGHPALDDEHKQLLGIIDDLFDAIQTGHGQDRIEEVLNRLEEYTTSHCGHEECVMRECGYPDLESHMVMHDEMQRRVLTLRNSASVISESELLEFVKNWWVSHILNQDKQYMPYLNAVVHPPVKSE